MVLPVAKSDTVVNAFHDYTLRIMQTELLELCIKVFIALKNLDVTGEKNWFSLFDGDIP